MTMEGTDKNQDAEKLPCEDKSRDKEYHWKCPDCGIENAIVWFCCGECGHINWPEE